MFVINVLYPNDPGSKFDMDYYTSKHLPLVQELMGPMGLRGLSFYQPMDMMGTPPYQVVAELQFDDAATAQAALAKHGAATQGDIPNFTDVQAKVVLGTVTTA
ncbi:EthD family reductase [Marinibaculum pumilum]|uniref:EthD family reductase n=1 Tax=Marinibaculum pumilum TaxID=1766165 RepID=A0ABV7L8X4_9PROT